MGRSLRRSAASREQPANAFGGKAPAMQYPSVRGIHSTQALCLPVDRSLRTAVNFVSSWSRGRAQLQRRGRQGIVFSRCRLGSKVKVAALRRLAARRLRREDRENYGERAEGGDVDRKGSESFDKLLLHHPLQLTLLSILQGEHGHWTRDERKGRRGVAKNRFSNRQCGWRHTLTGRCVERKEQTKMKRLRHGSRRGAGKQG